MSSMLKGVGVAVSGMVVGVRVILEVAVGSGIVVGDDAEHATSSKSSNPQTAQTPHAKTDGLFIAASSH